MMHLSKRKIMIILAERELRIKDLAALLGMCSSNLSATLNRSSVYPATAMRIANALDVPVSDILSD